MGNNTDEGWTVQPQELVINGTNQEQVIEASLPQGRR